jgi:opacity protein-like surface antigen
MKKLAIAALVLLAMSAIGSPAAAQSIGADCGDIFLSAANDSYVDKVEVGTFTNFNWYLVVELDYADVGLPDQQAANGLKGWECSVDVPATITVLNRTLQPETSLNIGQDDNWIIGTGQNVRAINTPFAVVAYTALLLSAQENLHLTLAGTTPSSFVPAVPGWVEFNPTGECTFADGSPKPCLRAFANDNVGEGDFWINQNIPIEDSS